MRVFLAAPFTQELDPRTGSVRPEYRNWLQGIIDAMARAGHEVISAHVREAWGERLETPAEALGADITALRRVDLLVAYSGSPPSPGVQLELGIAAALGIPVVLLLDQGVPSPYLAPGLAAVVPLEVVELRGRDEASGRALEAIESVVRRQSAPREL